MSKKELQDIKKEMEKIRALLERLMDEDACNYSEEQILFLSRKLDKLIIQFIKLTGCT